MHPDMCQVTSVEQYSRSLERDYRQAQKAADRAAIALTLKGVRASVRAADHETSTPAILQVRKRDAVVIDVIFDPEANDVVTMKCSGAKPKLVALVAALVS